MVASPKSFIRSSSLRDLCQSCCLWDPPFTKVDLSNLRLLLHQDPPGFNYEPQLPLTLPLKGPVKASPTSTVDRRWRDFWGSSKFSAKKAKPTTPWTIHEPFAGHWGSTSHICCNPLTKKTCKKKSHHQHTPIRMNDEQKYPLQHFQVACSQNSSWQFACSSNNNKVPRFGPTKIGGIFEVLFTVEPTEISYRVLKTTLNKIDSWLIKQRSQQITTIS